MRRAWAQASFCPASFCLFEIEYLFSLLISPHGDSRASGSSCPASRGGSRDAAAPLLAGVGCFQQGRNAEIAVGMRLGERGPWWHGPCIPTPEQKGVVIAGKYLQGCGMGLDGWGWGCYGGGAPVQRISASLYILNRK